MQLSRGSIMVLFVSSDILITVDVSILFLAFCEIVVWNIWSHGLSFHKFTNQSNAAYGTIGHYYTATAFALSFWACLYPSYVVWSVCRGILC